MFTADTKANKTFDQRNVEKLNRSKTQNEKKKNCLLHLLDYEIECTSDMCD